MSVIRRLIICIFEAIQATREIKQVSCNLDESIMLCSSITVQQFRGNFCKIWEAQI